MSKAIKSNHFKTKEKNNNRERKISQTRQFRCFAIFFSERTTEWNKIGFIAVADCSRTKNRHGRPQTFFPGEGKIFQGDKNILFV